MGLLLGAFVEATAYYCTYEYLLWCMHKPTTHVVERLGIFFRFNAQAQGQSVPNVQPKIAPQGPERKLDAA